MIDPNFIRPAYRPTRVERAFTLVCALMFALVAAQCWWFYFEQKEQLAQLYEQIAPVFGEPASAVFSKTIDGINAERLKMFGALTLAGFMVFPIGWFLEIFMRHRKVKLGLWTRAQRAYWNRPENYTEGVLRVRKAHYPIAGLALLFCASALLVWRMLYEAQARETLGECFFVLISAVAAVPVAASIAVVARGNRLMRLPENSIE